ncbi:hypothetical protein AB0K48_19120 [Nonomuraea sp. NPDC055795]
MRVRRDPMVIGLSEHHGDGTPGFLGLDSGR